MKGVKKQQGGSKSRRGDGKDRSKRWTNWEATQGGSKGAAVNRS